MARLKVFMNEWWMRQLRRREHWEVSFFFLMMFLECSGRDERETRKLRWRNRQESNYNCLIFFLVRKLTLGWWWESDIEQFGEDETLLTVVVLAFKKTFDQLQLNHVACAQWRRRYCVRQVEHWTIFKLCLRQLSIDDVQKSLVHEIINNFRNFQFCLEIVFFIFLAMSYLFESFWSFNTSASSIVVKRRMEKFLWCNFLLNNQSWYNISFDDW